MRAPHTVSEVEQRETFPSAHERMRGTGGTGVAESVGGADAGAVFLNGVVVYARYGGVANDDAIDALSGEDVVVKECRPEDVRMFRTYLRYLGDEAVLDAEPLDPERVGMQRVEGVLVDGVRNLASASWRGESDTSDRTFFPEGDRVALVPDAVALKRYVPSKDLSGYAAGDGKVVTFRDGELIDGAAVDIGDPVRSGVGAGGGWVVVDSRTKDDEQEEKDEEGILTRIF